MIPIQDKPDWARNGAAVVNTDVDAYLAHMRRKATAESNKAEIDNMKTTINNLNNQVSNINDTMNQILNLLKK